ncbi:mRNAadenosine methylase [Actinidia rufa]|uniref:mRNAadenosine methylase n=1 Tax=Actinidia rufa TaxID=165716 RepID=A0A7J0H1G1_9ERIC|nr:mRNAadenosine methylase [Actinidia rufa]
METESDGNGDHQGPASTARIPCGHPTQCSAKPHHFPPNPSLRHRLLSRSLPQGRLRLQNGLPFTPLPNPNPNPNRHPKRPLPLPLPLPPPPENHTNTPENRLWLWVSTGRLVKELPESKQYQQNESNSWNEGNQIQQANWRTRICRVCSDVSGEWTGGLMMGPRGGPRGMGGIMVMPRGMGVPPLHRPMLGLNASPMGGSNAISLKPRTEEDDMKDLEALLNKKSFRELQKSKTGEELLDLIRRPTAKETAVAAKVLEFISFISADLRL